MMAWRPDEDHLLHHVSYRWGVSSLIHAFLELILVLCVFLCAIISVTTTRLIKSSGLFHQTCVSCDIQHHHHRHSRQGSALTGCQKLADSYDLPRNRGSGGGSFRGDTPTPMNIICEDCTLFLSDCACTLKRASSLVDNDSSPRRFRYHVVTSGKTDNNDNLVSYCGSDHTVVWAIDDDNDDSCRRKQRPGGSCTSSFENIESIDDGSSERIAIDGTTAAAADGCGCRRCMGIRPGGGYSPASRRNTSRAPERKFAKVFPTDIKNTASGGGGSCSCSSCCCDHHHHLLADSASLVISEEGPAVIRESVEEDSDNGLRMMHRDGSSSCFLSDGRAAQHPGRFGFEDFGGDSSQESFSYNNSSNKRCSSPIGSSRYADVPTNRLKLSIDTDLLGGESSTPEWGWSLGSPSPSPAVGNEKEMEIKEAMEAGSIAQHEHDPEIGVMELREALHEEQEALAALYLELEEERNAASSAAHETMAMITRLQEEKAAIQMEARQYQRMTEEKHQYDQESMAMLQEILVRRDEEVYALEDEVNKYRKRLLTWGMDELMDRSTGGREGVGSPKRGGDVLLIERETLLLEGSEDWKHRRDRQDEKLLAEIMDWLHEANEKVVVAPERIEELNLLRGNFPKIAGNINRLLPGNGKKNLFESFSSVAVEDSQRGGIVAVEDNQRDGIVAVEDSQKDGMVAVEDSERDGLVNEEFKAHRDGVTNEEYEAHRDGTVNEEAGTHNRDSAAGYESFQGMMESLRREPSLRDVESLETLKKIEEKFHRQSSEGEVRRSGDELRQIWKNTLRSFESDEREDAEAGEVEEEAELRQSPTTAVEPANTTDTTDHRAEVTDTAVDADRSIGEKRMSVLEYVWKFEEQLHQLGNKKPPIQPAKLGLSTVVESVAEAPPESKGASLELMDSDKNKSSSFGGARPIPIKTRLRKRRAADSRHATPEVREAERDRFVVRGEGSPSSERATRNQDVRFDKSPDFEVIVHDVYEVKQDPRETFTEMSPHAEKDKRLSHDIKKYVTSTGNELVPGQFIDSHETARCVEHYLFDNGRLDFVASQTPEEHEANGKGRPDQDCSTGRVRHSVKEPGMCTQVAAIWSGECMDIAQASDGCALQSPSSVVTDSPSTQMQDVVQQLTHRLKALERDRQMMQDTIASLKKENSEMKILQDIAQQLRELRGIEQTAVTNTNTWPADDPAFVSSIKGMLSLENLRHSVQSQLSKLAQLFQGNGDPGGSQGNQQVGLFRLLHKSPLSKQQNPIERARSLRAVYAAISSSIDDQPPSSTPNLPVSQHSWPMNAKERSETAFSGWDY